MGNWTSSLQPQELITFKRLPKEASLGNIDIPERPENRHRTDVKWGVTLIVTVIVLLPFLIYTLYYSDVRRFFGYDTCGNICGSKNYHYDGIDCSGQDLTDKPYLQYTSRSRNSTGFCVSTCNPGYEAIFGICTASSAHNSGEFTNLKEETDHVGHYLKRVKWPILISCALSVLFSMGMLLLFRYAVATVVWGILGFSLSVLVALAIFLWYFYSGLVGDKRKDIQTQSEAVLIFAIAITIITLSLSVILIWSRKKIQLVISLLKETTKAVFEMPGLIVIPVITVIVLAILASIFIVLTVFLYSSGYLIEVNSDEYKYQLHPVMIFTIAFNSFVYVWISQFVTGLQYMVIAGAVAKWYFSRDRSFLRSPILTSAKCAFKYHLGSVALGSLILTIVTIIKKIILAPFKNKRIRIFVQRFIEWIESFLKFLSKNAYIITAMHGEPFIRSGKRAAKLILSNIKDVISINFIGDFVLGMAQLLVVIVTLLCTAGLLAASQNSNGNSIWAYLIVAVVSIVVVAVSFGVFQTTIDTIFICYCEDALMNDGMSRPYYMSRNLMQFIQDSKQIYAKK